MSFYKEYADFTEAQLEEIHRGLVANVDVTSYLDSPLSVKKMVRPRERLKENLKDNRRKTNELN